MKHKSLYWLPLVLLPAGNILVAVIKRQPMAPVLPYVLGAAAEELFYRRFLLKTVLLPRGKPRLMILLSAFLFAGIHLFNLRAGAALDETLVQVAFAFCFSVWAGAVTWKRSWLIPLLAHILLNLTATAELAAVSLIVGTVVLLDGVMLMAAEET